MKRVFMLTCFLFVPFIDNSDEANEYCYNYTNWLKCGKLVESARQCFCKTNCAPLLQVCRKYGTYIDWDFNGSPCFGKYTIPCALEFYNQVVPERNDTSLLISYVGNNYTLTCTKGYKMRETMEGIQVSCKGGDLTIKPPTLQCDRVTCPTDPPEILRCLERDVQNATINVTYYGEKRSCTCRNNCRNVTVTCGEMGEWEYDTAQCSDDNKVQAYPDQHYILWYLNGNYTVTCEPGFTLLTPDSPQCIDGELQYQQQVCEEVLATERHTMLLLSTSEIVLILVLCLVSCALICILIVTYLRHCKKQVPDSESFVLYTKSQPKSLRSNPKTTLTTDARPTLKTDQRGTLKIDPQSNLKSAPRPTLKTDPRSTLKADSRSLLQTDSKKALITDPSTILKTNPIQDCMIDNDLYISNEFTQKDPPQEDYYSNISEVLYENHETLRRN